MTSLLSTAVPWVMKILRLAITGRRVCDVTQTHTYPIMETVKSNRGVDPLLF